VAARFRIEQRERLQRRARRVATALERARLRFREASKIAAEAAQAVDGVDEGYERELEALRALTADLSLPALEQRHRQIEAWFRRRAQAVETLAAVRAEERAAAEKLAVLRAEEIDVQREYADQELEEQDDGWRNEQAAGDAADAALAAQRALEQACLRLFVEYVRAVQRE
jgi:hypothetical protein